MTLQEIRQIVSEKKPISRQHLYTYLQDLKIKPIGARQRPQRYPDDAPIRILVRLGFPRVVSLRTLQAVRRHSTDGRKLTTGSAR
jgi:hypothetical protein